MNPHAAHDSPSGDSYPLPGEAFATWLADFVPRLAAWCRRDERYEFLGRAVDHADLERRLRMQERGSPSQRFW